MKKDREAKLKFLLTIVTLRPPSELSRCDSVPNAAASVRSAPLALVESWLCFLLSILRKKRKASREALAMGRALPSTSGKRLKEESCSVYLKSKHSSSNLVPKLAQLSLALQEALLNLVPEVAPSASLAPQ